MDFFSRHPRTESGQEPTDLSQIAADDALIESLRSGPLFADSVMDSDADLVSTDDEAVYGRREHATEPIAVDLQVADMLRLWRQEIDSTPLPEPLDIDLATAIVRAAPGRRRAFRPMIAVTAAIAALLMGSAAIGARSAEPNDLLWPVTQILWGDRASSVLAGESVREGIDAAQREIDAGHRDAASSALVTVTSVITEVQQGPARATLESDLAVVRSQIESMSTTSATPTPAGSTSTAAPTSPTVPQGTSEAPVSTVDTSTTDPETNTGPSTVDTSTEPSSDSTDTSTDPTDTSTSDPNVPVDTTGDSTTETTPSEDTTTTEVSQPDQGGQGATDGPTTTTDPVLLDPNGADPNSTP